MIARVSSGSGTFHLPSARMRTGVPGAATRCGVALKDAGRPHFLGLQRGAELGRGDGHWRVLEGGVEDGGRIGGFEERVERE